MIISWSAPLCPAVDSVSAAVNIKLQWSRDPASLEFDPLLVVCAEGLCETDHPYAFAARECFKELLASDPAGDRTLPLVPRLVPCLRAGPYPAHRLRQVENAICSASAAAVLLLLSRAVSTRSPRVICFA